MRGAASIAATLAVALVALGVGCRASPAPAAPCNEEPFQCAAGQTCWPLQCTCPAGTPCGPDDCTPRFECVASAGAGPGDPCHLEIGRVTCGDLQTCVEIAGSGAGGACRSYCDPDVPDHGCASGFACVRLGVGGASSSAAEHVCVPATPEGDAGLTVQAPGGGGDAGTEDPDALPVQPDATPDSGQHVM
jgi:hypothetical protein